MLHTPSTHNMFQNMYMTWTQDMFRYHKVKTRDVSHLGLAIYIQKYLKAKRRRIMETQLLVLDIFQNGFHMAFSAHFWSCYMV